MLIENGLANIYFSQDFQQTEGELFLEHVTNEEIKLENSIIKSSLYNVKSGFGLRAYEDDFTCYAYSSMIEPKSLLDAVDIIKNGLKHKKKCFTQCAPVHNTNKYNNQVLTNSAQNSHNHLSFKNTLEDNQSNYIYALNPLYHDKCFIHELNFKEKIEILKDLESKVYQNCNYIKNVTIGLNGKFQIVNILKNNKIFIDLRPLSHLNIKVVIEKNNKIETGVASIGGALTYKDILQNKDQIINKAIHQATVKIDATRAPNGDFPVVLGNGFAGVLIHEAIGHGLEADAIYRKSSVFSNLLGKQVAAKSVTIIDSGNITNMRGSLNIDDEGTQTSENVLIKDGELVNFMCDNKYGKLLNMQSTGNCRRESCAHLPIVRMTNTYMTGDNQVSQDQLISDIKYGVFAKEFSGGQVDTTSGKYVFCVSEGYLIENGKITKPIKDAMIIDNCADSLKKIIAHGNDFELVNNSGFCGKDGQTVPVGIGQASCLISKMTVGG